jgi:MFS family permease
LGGNLVSSQEATPPPLWRWLVANVLLALIGITAGSPNVYPTPGEKLRAALGISGGVSTFMLTAGTLILYVTLPAGLFMDRFGSTITFFASGALVLATYVILPYCGTVSWLFILVFLLMAFGSSSLFVVCMQVALSRSPPSMKGFSLSIVSASMSLAFGVFLRIFDAGEHGPISCFGEGCVFSGVQLISIVICPILAVVGPLAYLLFRVFPQEGNQPETRHWSVLLDVRLWVLLFAELVTVCDGMLIIQCGGHLWSLYAGGAWKDGATKWGIGFSVTNAVMTIILSAIFDVVLRLGNTTRARGFGVFWMVFVLIPVAVAIVFWKTKSYWGLGAVTSAMGIPFGFGLTHVPTLVSDAFGNDKYGFAFGIVQFGAVAAAGATMPVVGGFSENGIIGAFAFAAGAHVVIALLVWFVVKIEVPAVGAMAIDEMYKQMT